jgi:hypothetical protein
MFPSSQPMAVRQINIKTCIAHFSIEVAHLRIIIDRSRELQKEGSRLSNNILLTGEADSPRLLDSEIGVRRLSPSASPQLEHQSAAASVCCRIYPSILNKPISASYSLLHNDQSGPTCSAFLTEKLQSEFKPEIRETFHGSVSFSFHHQHHRLCLPISKDRTEVLGAAAKDIVQFVARPKTPDMRAPKVKQSRFQDCDSVDGNLSAN